MKKLFPKVIEFSIYAIVFIVWILSLKIIVADLKWHNWGISGLYNKHGEYLNLLGNSVFLIDFVIAMILVDNYRLKKRVKELENLLKDHKKD